MFHAERRPSAGHPIAKMFFNVGVQPPSPKFLRARRRRLLPNFNFRAIVIHDGSALQHNSFHAGASPHGSRPPASDGGTVFSRGGRNPYARVCIMVSANRAFQKLLDEIDEEDDRLCAAAIENANTAPTRDETLIERALREVREELDEAGLPYKCIGLAGMIEARHDALERQQRERRSIENGASNDQPSPAAGLVPTNTNNKPTRSPRRPRKMTLRRALKQADRDGRRVVGASFYSDHVDLQFGEAEAAPPSTEVNPWDSVYDSNKKRPS
jgi:hypothetical protein